MLKYVAKMTTLQEYNSNKRKASQWQLQLIDSFCIPKFKYKYRSTGLSVRAPSKVRELHDIWDKGKN